MTPVAQVREGGGRLHARVWRERNQEKMLPKSASVTPQQQPLRARSETQLAQRNQTAQQA